MAKSEHLLLRESILRELFRRAAGKRCFGYDSRTGKGGRIKPNGWDEAQKPTDFGDVDRVCVEGDKEWQAIPRAM